MRGEWWPDLRWCFLFPDMSSLIALIRAGPRGLSLEGSKRATQMGILVRFLWGLLMGLGCCC